MSVKLNKLTSAVGENETEGRPVYNQTGGGLRFVGFHVDNTGKIQLNSQAIGFEASFDGSGWFTVNDSDGMPLTIRIKATQNVAHVDNYLNVAPAVLPLAQPTLFEGLPFVRVKMARPESENREIDLFFD